MTTDPLRGPRMLLSCLILVVTELLVIAGLVTIVLFVL